MVKDAKNRKKIKIRKCEGRENIMKTKVSLQKRLT